jgi:hypothetical protein
VWEAKPAVPFDPPLYVRRRATMSDRNKPRERLAPDKLTALLKIAGFSDDDFLVRRSFEIEVRRLGDAYWAGADQLTVAQYLDLLQQHADSLAAVSEQQRSLAPIHRIIRFVEEFHPADQLQGEALERYRESTSEPFFEGININEAPVFEPFDEPFDEVPDKTPSAKPVDLADGIERRFRTINSLIANPEIFAQLLNRSGAQDYRKRPIRATVVEPFLKLMDDYGVVTNRTMRPTKALFTALFDYIGVADGDRPKNLAMIVKAHRSSKKIGSAEPK